MSTIGQGQSLDVTAGQTVSDVLLVGGGKLNILAGGAALNTRNEGGHDEVFAGGSVTGTVLSGSGLEVVYAGGTATGTRLVNGGYQWIHGGLALGSVVGLSGQMVITPGGTADGVTIQPAGALTVETGGTLIGTVANAGLLVLQSASFAGTLGGTGSVFVYFNENAGLGGTNDLVGDITVATGASLLLSATGAFSGRLVVQPRGIAELAHPLAAGSGPVVLEGQGGTLRIAGLVMPGNTIEALSHGDVIALPAVAWDPAARVTLGAGNLLEVSADGDAYALQLDPGQSFTRDIFRVVPEGGGTAVTLFRAPAPDDFDGDGTSDVLMGAPDGGLFTWLIEDAAYAAWWPLANPGVQGYRWVATGDFDGDGQADLMLRNDAGELVDWFFEDGQIAGWRVLGTAATAAASGRAVVEAADMTGDGTADLLLEAPNGALSAMVLSQGMFSRVAPIGNPALSGYGVFDTGDFNRDGTADLLLANANGDLIVWLLKDGAYAGWFPIGNARDEGFGVVGTGDFDGDGTTDLLLSNGDHDLITWLVADGGYADWAPVGNAWRQHFGMLRTGDYDGDGSTDILLVDGHGNLVVWTIEAGAFADWHPLGNNFGYGVL